MDEIVRQAMAKWPNVPHCYGWLALDARGTWRMRDERAQALKLPGDPIRNPALLAFINRNYLHDERGRWYFQNGPQRVYVNLDTTPYIARTDPLKGFVLHTDEALGHVDAAWLTDEGNLLLKSAEKVALLDDRDMVQCLPMLRIDGRAASDEEIMEWLAQPSQQELMLAVQDDQGDRLLPLGRMQRKSLADGFGFIAEPQPAAG